MTTIYSKKVGAGSKVELQTIGAGRDLLIRAVVDGRTVGEARPAALKRREQSSSGRAIACFIGRLPISQESWPEIERAIAPFKAEQEQAIATMQAEQLPGLEHVRCAWQALDRDQERSDRERAAHFRAETAAMPAPVSEALRSAYRETCARYPRAACYLRLERRIATTDNDQCYTDCKRAMAALENGESLETAREIVRGWLR